MITLHNFSSDPLNVPLALNLDEGDYRLVDLIEDSEFEVGSTGDAEVPLEGYGHRWMRLRTPETRRLV